MTCCYEWPWRANRTNMGSHSKRASRRKEPKPRFWSSPSICKILFCLRARICSKKYTKKCKCVYIRSYVTKRSSEHMCSLKCPSIWHFDNFVLILARDRRRGTKMLRFIISITISAIKITRCQSLHSHTLIWKLMLHQTNQKNFTKKKTGRVI